MGQNLNPRAPTWAETCQRDAQDHVMSTSKCVGRLPGILAQLPLRIQ